MISGQKDRFYRFDRFAVDAASRSLKCDGEAISLNPKAFDLLLALLERPGEVITKDELLDSVWKGQFVEEGNLTVHVAAIRKALGEKKNGLRYVATVPGRGYQFVGQMRSEGDALVIEEHSLSRITVEHDEEDVSPVDAPHLTTSTKRLGTRTIVFASVLVGLAAVAFLAYRFGGMSAFRSNTPAEKTNRQLTGNGKVSAAALSPDGKYFVYKEFEKGRFSLWYGNTAGGNLIQLQPLGDTAYDGLTFGPDGSEIFYVEKGVLMKIPVLGGPPERVLEGVPNSFAISSDGKQLAFVHRDNVSNTSSLMTRELDGGAERQVLKLPALNAFSSYPAWSSDSTKLAIGVNSGAGAKEQYVLTSVEVSDGTTRTLNSRSWDILGKTVWLHDDTGVVFNAVGAQSDFHIWMADYPSGDLRCITNDLSRYGRASVFVSDDGNILLSVRDELNTNIWTGPASDIKQSRQITNKEARKLDGATGLSWTPDGKIVASSFFDNSYSIWTMDPDGSNAKHITSPGFWDRFPQATSDGRYIIFQSNRSGGEDIWRVNTDGSDLRRLTSDGGSSFPDLTPDGAWVLYTSADAGINSIWKVPIDGGQAVRLTDRPSDFPKVSPDGRYFACAWSEQTSPTRSQIAVFPIDGGVPLYRFERADGSSLNNGLHWSPDGSAIIYRDFAAGLWRQPISGQAPAKMADLPDERIYFFDWSKDGGSFALSYGTEIRDVVLISHFH